LAGGQLILAVVTRKSAYKKITKTQEVTIAQSSGAVISFRAYHFIYDLIKQVNNIELRTYIGLG